MRNRPLTFDGCCDCYFPRWARHHLLLLSNSLRVYYSRSRMEEKRQDNGRARVCISNYLYLPYVTPPQSKIKPLDWTKKKWGGRRPKKTFTWEHRHRDNRVKVKSCRKGIRLGLSSERRVSGSEISCHFLVFFHSRRSKTPKRD